MGVVVLLGPPGSGKGTAASVLAKDSRWIHLSTGAVLREAIRAGTERGRRIAPYMEGGRLVPDLLVTEIVEERLEREGPDTTFLLDGFPRTLNQAQLLDEYLERAGRPLLRVILLEVATEAVVQRLLGRLTCPACRAIYHLTRMPPRVPGVCDECGAALEQRDDDVESTIRERMQVYREQTAPLIDYYLDRGVLRRVDAGGDVAETVAAMRREMESVS